MGAYFHHVSPAGSDESGNQRSGAVHGEPAGGDHAMRDASLYAGAWVSGGEPVLCGDRIGGDLYDRGAAGGDLSDQGLASDLGRAGAGAHRGGRRHGVGRVYVQGKIGDEIVRATLFTYPGALKRAFISQSEPPAMND